MARGDREPRRRGRLSRSGDFERAYREGRSHGNRFLILYAFSRPPGEAGGARLGISVGRKIGGAVERNRIKRALREGFWALADRLPPDHDFVIVARPGIKALVEREQPPGVRASLEDVIGAVGLGPERLS